MTGVDLRKLFINHKGPSYNIFGGPSLDPLDASNVSDESGPPDRGGVSQLRPNQG